jgi:hypothetical protein
MKLYTLWTREGCEEGEDPWILAATDQVSVEANNGFPDEFQKAVDKNPDARLLTLEIPRAALRLWDVPVVQAAVVSSEGAGAKSA